VAFAAYAPNVQDVFAFHDALEDVAAGQLTYVVTGWYADPDQDPLRGVSQTQPGGWSDPTVWLELMQRFGWSVGPYDLESDEVRQAVAAGQNWLNQHAIATDSQNPQSRYPARILCHGMVYDVNWTGKTGPQQLGVPQPPASEVDIAVGNTAMDALAALIQKHLGRQYPHAAEILQAFQYKLLHEMDTQGFEARLLEGIREEWFGESHTGRLWEIIEPQRPDLAAGPLKAPAPITDDLKQRLAALNKSQTRLNTLTVLLQEQRGELYRAWWKQQASASQFPPLPEKAAAQVAAAYRTAKSNVAKSMAATETLREERNTAARIICGQIGAPIQEDPDSGEIDCPVEDDSRHLRLVDRTAPRFWHPNDPVVLVLGVTRTYKHGADGRFKDDDALFCRVSGQTLKSITVNSVIGKSGADCQDNAPCYTVSAEDIRISEEIDIGDKIPLEVLDLLLEAYLLDTTNATQLAARVMEKLNLSEPDVTDLAQQVAREQTLVWNAALHPALGEGPILLLAGLGGGVVPSKVAVQSWTPPWSPLYMDWEVAWAPSYADPKQVLIDADHNSRWELEAGRQDFVWQGPAPPDFANVRTFKGRTPITPKAANVFAATLEKFLHDHRGPDLNLDDEFLKRAGALGGRADSDDSDSVAVLNKVLELVKHWNILSQSVSGFNQLLLMRDISQRTPPAADMADLVAGQDHAMPSTITNPDFFNPIRAGHLQISNLWIVDDFGQVFNAAGEKGMISEVSPVRAMGLVTAGTSTQVQLPPRIIQDGRIQFRFVAAEGDESREAASDPAANPICGWILPNHLDRGLMIYDAGGNLNGEILVTGEGSGRRARWQPAPHKSAAVGAAPEIDNRDLAGFVNGLLDRDDSAQAFEALCSAIDATLWTVDPLGDRGNQNLAVLIGRPLALVRAVLYFELAGPPACDQSWQQTNRNETRDFYRTGFPVNLGNFQLRDDGLLGYFVEPDFSQFHTVYLPPHLNAPPKPYLVQQDIRLPFNYPDQPEAYTRTTTCLLVDPRGGIHAQTGLFPNKKIEIPPMYVEQAIEQMDVTFRTGPLLTAPDTIRMPIPAEIDGTWSWIEHSGIEILQSKIEKAGDRAQLSDVPPRIREGWLKLSEMFARQGN